MVWTIHDCNFTLLTASKVKLQSRKMTTSAPNVKTARLTCTKLLLCGSVMCTACSRFKFGVVFYGGACRALRGVYFHVHATSQVDFTTSIWLHAVVDCEITVLIVESRFLVLNEELSPSACVHACDKR